MAVDKYVDSAQLDSDLTDIADAIREKGGTESQLAFPDGFISAVEALPDGGGVTPSGSINITENGTYDVAAKASAVVNVPTGVTPTGTKQISITQNGTVTEDVTNYASAEIAVNVSASVDWDDFALGNIPSGALSLGTAQTIRDYLFYGSTAITSISAPNATEVKQYGFHSCSGVLTVSFPELTTTGTYSFRGLRSLTKASFPKLSSIGQGCFSQCGKSTAHMEYLCLPAASGTLNAMFEASFIDVIDIGPNVSALTGRNFYGTSSFDTIILRSSSVVSADTNSLNKITSSHKVYVPQALISNYQSASNWSSKAPTFMAIEGSIYENAYADGTPIV